MEFLSDIFLSIIGYTHRYTGNYGWDIIVLTVIIRIVLLPLTLSSLRGMKAMQQAQPRIKEMQAKYKDDKEKLNKEMLVLYKEIGFNPVTGCLPMLLQIPIFIVLYRVLLFPVLNGYIFVNTSFFGMDLTTAPFNRLSPDFLANLHLVMPGMINLSSLGIGFFKNTYFYVPALPVVILMTVTTIAQQKMMTTDPQQKNMMWMFSLMFLYFAFIMPTGVLLYWGASNALQFAQQALTKTPKQAAPAPKKSASKSSEPRQSDEPKPGKKEQEKSDSITDKTEKNTPEKPSRESPDTIETKPTPGRPSAKAKKKTYPAAKKKAGKSKKRKK